jgi:thiol-disulfide isomerase/thioredoxin
MVLMRSRIKFTVIIFAGTFFGFLLFQSLIPRIEILAGQSKIEEVQRVYFENILKKRSMTSMDGKVITLADKKILLINFWATWCTPCLTELPGLQALYDKYKSKGLEIIAVNTDTENAQAEVQKFLRTNNYTFPIVLDESGTHSNEFKVVSIPITFLVQKGKILEIFKGETEFNSQEFHSKISDLK